MKRFARWAVVALVALVASAIAGLAVAGNSPGKVTVCHVNGNGTVQSITVGYPALAAHILHGDPVGACDEPFPD